MADARITLDRANPLPFRAHDNGDGTFSLCAVANPASTPIGVGIHWRGARFWLQVCSNGDGTYGLRTSVHA